MIVVMVDVIRMQIQVYYWLPNWLVVLLRLGYGIGGINSGLSNFLDKESL